MTQRALNTVTLDAAARDWAGHWFLPSRYSKINPKMAIGGRAWVLANFYNCGLKDEFDYLLSRFRKQLGADALKEFGAATGGLFTPRDDAVFEKWLAEKLAINPTGEHIPGLIGKVQVGERIVGFHQIEVETPLSLMNRRVNGLDKSHRQTYLKTVRKRVPIFAGEMEEHGHFRLAEFIADQSGALNTNMSFEVAQAGLDALLNGLDEGTLGAVIQGHSDSGPGQPVDPDAAALGVVLFSMTMNTTAFPTAADGAPGAVATASPITDDSLADATGTLNHCRVSSSSVADTVLDPHLEGSAGITSSFDFDFNTIAIVINTVVSMSAYAVTLPQGPTAT